MLKRPFVIIFFDESYAHLPDRRRFDILIYIAFINFGIFILYRVSLYPI